MSNRLYLFVMFGLMTLAFHLAYILSVPNVEMGKLFTRISAEAGVNKFAILNENKANRLLKHNPKNIVATVCLFDLSSGPVQIKGVIAGNYWSLSIYSERGDIIYTLNDRQAAAKKIFITIDRAPNKNLHPVKVNDNKLNGAHARISSEHQQGLVVIRSGIDLPNQDEYLKKTANALIMQELN